MSRALADVAAAIEAMRTRTTTHRDIAIVQLLLRRAVWWISHAESGLGRSPLDESDFRRSVRLLDDELKFLYEPEPKSWDDLDPLKVDL